MKLVLAAAFLASSIAMAADVEHKVETSTDTSKNPITGTVTETQKAEESHKGPKGEKQAKMKKKTKHMTDGSKKTTTETESSTEQKH